MANLIVASVDPRDVGIATGINTVTRTVGGAFGSALVTALLTADTIAGTPLPTETPTPRRSRSRHRGLLAVAAALAIPRVGAGSREPPARGARPSPSRFGLMFWLPEKTFSGSYSAFTAARRS